MVAALNFPDSIVALLKVFISLLLIATVSLAIAYKLKPGDLTKNLIERTYSWWLILAFYVVCMGVHQSLIFVGLALVSFIAHREMVSHLVIPQQLRRVVLWSYLVIPFQYYLARLGHLIPFLLFIPVVTLFLLSLRTIIEDEAQDSLSVLSKLQWSLMVTTFNISHIAYLSVLPAIPGQEREYHTLIFFLIFVGQTNDIFQYIFGKLFGRFKISPNISPNKTVAGFLGGIAGSLFLGHSFSGIMPLSYVQVLILSGTISVTGFLGDLNISAIKRSLKIKNMSNFIPGHGGVLDRIDSLIFSSVVYFYMIYFWVYA